MMIGVCVCERERRMREWDDKAMLGKSNGNRMQLDEMGDGEVMVSRQESDMTESESGEGDASRSKARKRQW
jgi:hypothetical protein